MNVMLNNKSHANEIIFLNANNLFKATVTQSNALNDFFFPNVHVLEFNEIP